MPETFLEPAPKPAATGRCFLAGLALLATAALAHVSSAQTPPSGTGLGSAREAFAAGETAFQQNDYELALRLFRRAFELAPNDAVRFNIAVCLERLARFREAAGEYDAAARSPSLDDSVRSRARDLGARTRERLGTLRVDGRPPGADVLVDGERLCALPCRVGVDPRDHEVVVRSGGAQARARVVIERGAEVGIRLSAVGNRVPSDAPPPSRWPSWLTWGGGSVTAVGAVGAGTFGAITLSLADQYRAAPTARTRDEGILMRDLTNASWVVLGVGLAAVVVDAVIELF